MYKAYKYKVTYARYDSANAVSEWITKEVTGISIDITLNKVSSAHTVDNMTIVIDDTGSFLQEFTGMFDKAGAPLFGGDIVKHNNVLVPISWVNAAWCVIPSEEADPIYFTQQNVMEMERIGDIYRNGALLEKPIDEKIFEAKS